MLGLLSGRCLMILVVGMVVVVCSGVKSVMSERNKVECSSGFMVVFLWWVR